MYRSYNGHLKDNRMEREKNFATIPYRLKAGAAAAAAAAFAVIVVSVFVFHIEYLNLKYFKHSLHAEDSLHHTFQSSR